MARMTSNNECTSKMFYDSSPFTNQILEYGATCHTTPEVSDLIPSSLEDTDIYIGVADGHYITDKQKYQVRIKMRDDNGNPFIATLHNVLLETYLCDRLLSIIKLMNSGKKLSF